MSASLVGSEMCIRDRLGTLFTQKSCAGHADSPGLSGTRMLEAENTHAKYMAARKPLLLSTGVTVPREQG
eukprot:1524998-Alexandrium_andersonii.AAC.1